jgi:hypothetical protein
MAKSKAIIIATQTDGTQSVVGDILPRSEARAAFRGMEPEEGLKTLELYELRTPNKRRKMIRSTQAEESEPDPRIDEVVDALVSGGVILPEDGFNKSGVPKVGVLNDIFETDFDSKTVKEIWAEVQDHVSNQ